jgi:hypothetical protein
VLLYRSREPRRAAVLCNNLYGTVRGSAEAIEEDFRQQVDDERSDLIDEPRVQSFAAGSSRLFRSSFIANGALTLNCAPVRARMAPMG